MQIIKLQFYFKYIKKKKKEKKLGMNWTKHGSNQLNHWFGESLNS